MLLKFEIIWIRIGQVIRLQNVKYSFKTPLYIIYTFIYEVY